ncbi:hypothetical protein Hanom_Chr17g01551931 [Helianthus anomalus]
MFWHFFLSLLFNPYFIGYVEVCFNLEDTNKKDGTIGKRLNLKLKDVE